MHVRIDPATYWTWPSSRKDATSVPKVTHAVVLDEGNCETLSTAARKVQADNSTVEKVSSVALPHSAT